MHTESKRNDRFMTDALHRVLLRLSCVSQSVKSITDRLFMCPSAEMPGRKGHNMKIRMYYESKLDKDTIVLEVPDDECAVLVENDYTSAYTMNGITCSTDCRPCTAPTSTGSRKSG